VLNYLHAVVTYLAGKSRIKFLHRLTPVAVALGAIALASAVHAADTIRIGIPQPMTGPNTQYGDQIQAGTLTAIESINAKGGVKGKRNSKRS
jgi:branched-chain amino acid transport system substrate-binding protein